MQASRKVAVSVEATREHAFVVATVHLNNIRALLNAQASESDTDQALRDAIRESSEVSRPNHVPAVLICSGSESKPNEASECHLEWGSDALHAYYLMTEMRAAIIWVRKSKLRDALVDPTRSSWLDLRDIFCDGHPLWLYTDLDGVTRMCRKADERVTKKK